MRRPKIRNCVFFMVATVALILFITERGSEKEREPGNPSESEISNIKRGSPNSVHLNQENAVSTHKTGLSRGNVQNQSTLVLLICYMRGGSTFVSQVFNRNPAALYWTEPIASMYVSMFATPMWQEPFEISHYHDGKPRPIPEKEQEFVITNLNRMSNCDYDLVPSPVLFHQSIINSAALSPFFYCIHDKVPKQPFMRICLDPLSRHCPKYIAKSVETHCNTMMELALTNSSLSDPKSDVIQSNTGTKIIYTKFKNYVDCKKTYDKHRETCSHFLTDKCTAAKIKAFKLLRLPMSWTEALVKKNQGNIKIIHYVRDPRGTMTSRRAVASWDRSAALPVELESKLLCEKMLKNMNEFRRLHNLYPGVYKQIRYEDLADLPVETTRIIYDHVGKTMPQVVTKWLTENTHAARDGSEFQQFKQNSSKTARAWRAKIKPKLKEHMDSVCEEVIKQLGYTV